MADINDYPSLLAACEDYVLADRLADVLLGSPVQNVDDSLALARACAARHVAHMALEQLTLRLLTNAGRWAGETPAQAVQAPSARPDAQRALQDAYATVLADLNGLYGRARVRLDAAKVARDTAAPGQKRPANQQHAVAFNSYVGIGRAIKMVDDCGRVRAREAQLAAAGTGQAQDG